MYLMLSPKSSYGQNDSILPNYEAGYSLLEMSFDWQFNWVYYPEIVYFNNYDEDDTVDVGVSPYAKIYFDSYKAYILGTDISTSLHIYPDSAVVLYDFGLNIGDTAYFEDISGSGSQDIPVIVEDITYQEIQGELHKKIILSNQDVWVQGIGSLVHPLWPVMSHFEINYIFCSANLFYVNEGNFSDLFFENEDCSWYYEIGITELEQSDRKLVKCVDLLGRDTECQSNILLINVYDDGSTEKVFRTE